jgi:hypothetical protein
MVEDKRKKRRANMSIIDVGRGVVRVSVREDNKEWLAARLNRC